MTQRESRAQGPAPETSTALTAKASIAAGSVSLAEPRWCRFAAVFCRCSVEPIETATMDVCASHFLVTDGEAGHV